MSTGKAFTIVGSLWLVGMTIGVTVYYWLVRWATADAVEPLIRGVCQ